MTKTTLAILLSCRVAAADSVLYRLNSGSSSQRGCVAPCLCPDTGPAPVSGTFFLTPRGSTNQFKTYSITDISWKFPFDASTTAVVTGRGTYNVGSSQQQLTANLQINGGKTQYFDSGLVTNSAVFPNIKVGITNAQYCFQTVFHIVASPTPVPHLDVQAGSINEVVLSWAVSSNAFVLQENSDMTATNWTTVTNAPTVTGEQNQVVLAPTSGCNFYRLWPSGN